MAFPKPNVDQELSDINYLDCHIPHFTISTNTEGFENLINFHHPKTQSFIFSSYKLSIKFITWNLICGLQKWLGTDEGNKMKTAIPLKYIWLIPLETKQIGTA